MAVFTDLIIKAKRGSELDSVLDSPCFIDVVFRTSNFFHRGDYC